MKFVKIAQEAGLFVHLRIGPYACAEWNYGSISLPFLMLDFKDSLFFHSICYIHQRGSGGISFFFFLNNFNL